MVARESFAKRDRMHEIELEELLLTLCPTKQNVRCRSHCPKPVFRPGLDDRTTRTLGIAVWRCAVLLVQRCSRIEPNVPQCGPGISLHIHQSNNFPWNTNLLNNRHSQGRRQRIHPVFPLLESVQPVRSRLGLHRAIRSAPGRQCCCARRRSRI